MVDTARPPALHVTRKTRSRRLAVAPLHHGAPRCDGCATLRTTMKASLHRHNWLLSRGSPADPSDPWNSHAAPVSPLQQFNTTSDFWYRQGVSPRISPFKCWVARLWNLHENSYP